MKCNVSGDEQEFKLKLFIGTIYTSYKPLEKVEAMIVAGDRVVYVGAAERAEAICREIGCEIHRLGKEVVLPGFIDAHAHLDGIGLKLNTIDLHGIRSIEELKKVLKLHSHRFSKWVIGRGWDQELFQERRYPTRWDLDEAVPDKPVLIVRTCGHVGVVNSKALEMLRIDEVFRENPNLVRNEDGVPTGIVMEDVLSYIEKSMEFSIDEVKRFLLDAQQHVVKNGVTTMGFVNVSLRTLLAVFDLYRHGLIRLRLRLYLEPEALSMLESLGIQGALGDDMVRIQGIKVFADGSLGGRTAWLSSPYSDDPRTTGTPLISKSKLEELATRVAKLGMQLAVHAIGDKAIDLVIDVFEKLGHEPRLYRFRIEHASLVRDDQLEKLHRLGVVAVVQPHFIISDWWIVKRLGSERARYAYRFKTMLDHGIPLAFSSDAPVEPINPWETVYAAVDRGKSLGIELANLTPYEGVDMLTALHLYTYGSAYALRDSRLGKLKPGYYADFIIVDRDPLSLAEAGDIAKVHVVATYVGGEAVYRE